MRLSFLQFLRGAILPALAVTLFTAPQSQAAPCTAGTLADYIALNRTGGCQIGDYTYLRFSFSAVPPSNATAPPSPSAVSVTPDNATGIPGISFLSPSLFQLFDNLKPDSANYTIGYSVDPPPVILGETLALDPPFGNVQITQNVCLSDVFANQCTLGIPLTHSVVPSSPNSFLSFPTPVAFIDIQDVISLNTTPGNGAGFDSVSSAPAAAPEPATMGLLGLSGLLAAGYTARRRQSKASR